MVSFNDVKTSPKVWEYLGIRPELAAVSAVLILAHEGAEPVALFAITPQGTLQLTHYRALTHEEADQTKLMFRALCRTRFPILRIVVPESDPRGFTLLTDAGWQYDGVWRKMNDREDGFILTFQEVTDGEHIQRPLRQPGELAEEQQQNGADPEPVHPGAADPDRTLRADAIEPAPGPDLQRLPPAGGAGDQPRRAPQGGGGFTWSFGHSAGRQSGPDPL